MTPIERAAANYVNNRTEITDLTAAMRADKCERDTPCWQASDASDRCEPCQRNEIRAAERRRLRGVAGSLAVKLRRALQEYREPAYVSPF